MNLNIESVPRLPTSPARRTLEDPRGRPYFVFWTTDDGRLSDYFRMARLNTDTVRISRPRGVGCRISVIHRPLPRGHGTFLLYLCPTCGRTIRYLYGLRLIANGALEDGVWRCYPCAGLLFASQGRYRRRFERMMFTAFYGDQRVRDPRPRHPWDPRAVSDPRTVVDEFRGALIQAPDR